MSSPLYLRGRNRGTGGWRRREGLRMADYVSVLQATREAPQRVNVAYPRGMRGEPVETIAGPLTELPVPAHSEIVVEGEIPPVAEESAFEGPFGEWPSYYSHTGPETKQ